MDEHRVVVIGSGPCGATAAWQLVQCGIPVTLLESGSEVPSGALVRLLGRNVYRQKPKGHFGSDCAEHQSSGDPKTKWYFNLNPGGLSNQWTGAVPRFAPEDFTEGARLHERYEWPVSYAELAPYYERVERLMAVVASGTDVPCLPGGYAADQRHLPQDWAEVAEVARAHGQGLTTLPLADGPPNLVTRRGTAFNSYTNIVQPLLTSPLFSMKTGAHARRLVWSGEKRRVTSVVYHDAHDGGEHELKAKSFVVAGGPLQTARLLFDSTSTDFPQGLGNSQDLVGRYLHDHPREWWMIECGKLMSRLSPSIYLTRGPYAGSQPLFATSWTIGAPTTKEKLLSFTPLKTRVFGVQVFGTMIPTADTRVTPIQGALDDKGCTKLNLDIRFDEATMHNLIEARQRLVALLEASNVPCKLLPVPPDQVAPGGAVHYGGVARMHRSSEHGVVDGKNRLFDAPNVLVCDAACFTTGVEKNPTLTGMALSARACENLANALKTDSV